MGKDDDPCSHAPPSSVRLCLAPASGSSEKSSKNRRFVGVVPPQNRLLHAIVPLHCTDARRCSILPCTDGNFGLERGVLTPCSETWGETARPFLGQWTGAAQRDGNEALHDQPAT